MLLPPAAASSLLVSARPRATRSIIAVDDLQTHRRSPRRARLHVPNSSLAGDAGALLDSGGGGGDSAGGGGGKGDGKGSGGGGDDAGDSSGSSGEDENAPISAAAVAATVRFFRQQLAVVSSF